MSLTAKLAKAFMNLTGRPAESADELLEKARKYNSKNHFRKPTDKKALYRVEKLENSCDLLSVRSAKRRDNSNSAVLFIFGAGGMMNAWKPHMMMVRYIADKTGAEVFMPIYPLCTDAPVSAAVETAYETYKRMLADYPPHKITITGDSSGGACCLSLISMINKRGSVLPMPKLAILHSPSGVPHNKESWQRMKKQSRKDARGTFEMVRFFPQICCNGEKVPPYMIHPYLGDYHNAPKTLIYYSADETLASLGRDIREAYHRDGARLNIHYEPGMIHCYSSYPAFKESKAACIQWIVEILKLQKNGEKNTEQT